jgi:hypothetical protein
LRNADLIFYFDNTRDLRMKQGEEPEHPRSLDMIKSPWKRVARPLETKITVNPRLIELETAKQILEEIFHARPSDVEEMIQMS